LPHSGFFFVSRRFPSRYVGRLCTGCEHCEQLGRTPQFALSHPRHPSLRGFAFPHGNPR
jgi:hypothetical protein